MCRSEFQIVHNPHYAGQQADGASWSHDLECDDIVIVKAATEITEEVTISSSEEDEMVFSIFIVLKYLISFRVIREVFWTAYIKTGAVV